MCEEAKAWKQAMPHSKRRRFVAPIIIGLQLSACQQKPEAPANIEPASRVEYTGQALYRVRLTAKRAAELGLKTAAVREEKMAGILRKVVPSTAVVYDQHGNPWMFKNPDSLVFVRERTSVDHVDGELAILADGPPAGTAVVIAGAAELLNDEFSKDRQGFVESNIRESGEGKKSSGTATMLEDGTIKLVYKTAGTSGLAASVVIEYKPQDEEYQKIMEQVGGLKVGETKDVTRWPGQ
jgi:hypothetical protein